MSETPESTQALGRPLPRIALGCGNFGGVGSAPEFFGQGMTTDQALAMMDAAWESEITHFDTADAYGGGRSEAAIGRWIATRGIRPALTTKTYNPMLAGADHGLAPERIARQLRASLDRLGVDRVEWYLAHDFDPDVPLADLALAWLLADDRVAQIVIGPGRPEHLVPVGEALQHPLSAGDLADIERAVA